MEILFLGTSAMVPTKERNQPSLLVSTRNYDILIDCGEGTQRQLKSKAISPNRIRKILITHWHGDHSLGLPGLLMTLGQNEFREKLQIYGPKGTQKNIEMLMKVYLFNPSYELEVIECDPGKIFGDSVLEIFCESMKHGVPCLNFSIREKDRRRIKTKVIKELGIPDGPLLGKLQRGQTVEWKNKKVTPEETTSIVRGKKLTYITDTEVVDQCYDLARDSDVLICEATLKSELEEKATERQHLTPKMAAHIASLSNSKKLILTHFSQRYRSENELEEDAKDVFDDVKAAYDYFKLKI
jgi:ribonuclease Z